MYGHTPVNMDAISEAYSEISPTRQFKDGRFFSADDSDIASILNLSATTEVGPSQEDDDRDDVEMAEEENEREDTVDIDKSHSVATDIVEEVESPTNKNMRREKEKASCSVFSGISYFFSTVFLGLQKVTCTMDEYDYNNTTKTDIVKNASKDSIFRSKDDKHIKESLSKEELRLKKEELRQLEIKKIKLQTMNVRQQIDRMIKKDDVDKDIEGLFAQV